jgi:hypothetical protein
MGPERGERDRSDDEFERRRLVDLGQGKRLMWDALSSS